MKNSKIKQFLKSKKLPKLILNISFISGIVLILIAFFMINSIFGLFFTGLTLTVLSFLLEGSDKDDNRQA